MTYTCHACQAALRTVNCFVSSLISRQQIARQLPDSASANALLSMFQALLWPDKGQISRQKTPALRENAQFTGPQSSARMVASRAQDAESWKSTQCLGLWS